MVRGPGAADDGASLVYDAARNRRGVRCTLPDYQVSLWGRSSSPTAGEIGLIDRWVSRIGSDHGDLPLPVRVVRDRPADAVDACWIGTQKVTDQSLCRTAYPWFGTPRIAAGGPLADNVLAYRLRPLDPTGYGVTFTAARPGAHIVRRVTRAGPRRTVEG